MPIMADKIFTALLALGFPITVLLGGDVVLSGASGRPPAVCQLTDEKQFAPKPLNRRWFGYGAEDAKAYWSWLESTGRQTEKTFLTLDLLFPFLYGGALAASLWWIWMTLGRPFHPAWILAPLVMITMADWLENLIQLAQLRHYMESNGQYVQSLWIQLAGCATIIKLWLTGGLYVSLAGLILKLLLTCPDRRLAGDATK